MSATNWEDVYRVQTARIAELERENAELNATLDTIISADERAIKLWRAAHPGNELLIPDRAKLVAWLLEQNAELRAHAERVGEANDRLVVENGALRKDYVEMGQTALRSTINHYIGSIIMTDEQRKLREAVKKELPERASWAEIYAVYEIVRDRTKEAKQ